MIYHCNIKCNCSNESIVFDTKLVMSFHDKSDDICSWFSLVLSITFMKHILNAPLEMIFLNYERRNSINIFQHMSYKQLCVMYFSMIMKTLIHVYGQSNLQSLFMYRSNMFRRNADIHSYPTRQAANLILPFAAFLSTILSLAQFQTPFSRREQISSRQTIMWSPGKYIKKEISGFLVHVPEEETISHDEVLSS